MPTALLQPLNRPPRSEILGCPVDALSLEDTVGFARRSMARSEGAIQVSINALKVAIAENDARFRQALASFDVASADGQPVVWASRLLRCPLPGRVNGTDLMFELLAAARDEGLGLYVLGARQELLEAAVAKIRADYPGIRLAGYRNGYFDESEKPTVVAQIAASGADLLFVALPSPEKEWFMVEHARDLGVGFAMGVGGSIDVLAGAIPRAPVWMQRTGLEWLFRVVQEPRRMWRRYLRTNTRFVVLLAKALVMRSKARRA